MPTFVIVVVVLTKINLFSSTPLFIVVFIDEKTHRILGRAIVREMYRIMNINIATVEHLITTKDNETLSRSND